MMGRAGRPQYDSSAVACVFVHEPKKAFYVRFLYEPFPVESFMHKKLADNINAEVVGGTIENIDDVFEYMSCTYFFRRLTANPSYYDAVSMDDDALDEALQKNDAQRPSTSSSRQDRIVAFTEGIINEALEELKLSKCLEIKKGVNDENTFYTISATKLGNIASFYYVSHLTVRAMYGKLKAPLGVVDVLRLLCDAHEYSTLPVRHNEDVLNGELIKSCPVGMGEGDEIDSPHIKAFILLQCPMFNIDIPITDYVTALKSVLDQSIRIIQAMADITIEYGTLSTLLSINFLMQCLTQGMHMLMDPLYMFPLITEEHVNVFRSNKLTFHDVLETDKNAASLLHALDCFSRTEVDTLASLFLKLPLLRVSIQVSRDNAGRDILGRITSAEQKPIVVERNCSLCIKVNLTSPRIPQVQPLTSKFAKASRHGWWIILGDSEVDELVGMKRVVATRKRDGKAVYGASTTFRFVTPEEKGMFSLSMYICSDVYVGLDQQYTVDMHVK
eukprot:GHVO01065428.1.p1 GENE.GHVO01065428.1~~GHVO01065428.1.p1  ORF type:complete len:501 (+),score=87.74 GHVO01065428.1:290-1792(+)